MKPVYKCEYCKFMGSEEEVLKHEDTCIDNYDKRSCTTCKHRKLLSSPFRYGCDNGIEIPEGKMYQNCNGYERKEKAEFDFFGDIFGGAFRQ